MPLIWSLALGCRIGLPTSAPPAALTGAGVASVQVLLPVVDDGLAEALRRATVSELAARGLYGRGDRLELRLRSLDEAPAASSSVGRVEIRRLRIEARLLGPSPRELVLDAGAGYVRDGLAPMAGDLQRREANDRLARELAVQLADWVALPPAPTAP